jgi:hypothetical protein
MNAKEHRARHVALHASLDELAADYLTHNRDKRLGDTSVLQLLEWSHRQTIDPDANDDRLDE